MRLSLRYQIIDVLRLLSNSHSLMFGYRIDHTHGQIASLRLSQYLFVLGSMLQPVLRSNRGLGMERAGQSCEGQSSL